MGATVPDLRGLFLRGHGSQVSYHYGAVSHQSWALRAIQGDAIRNITGYFNALNFKDEDVYGFYHGGALRNGGAPAMRSVDAPTDHSQTGIHFDASYVVPVANENRPVNMAVRYLIRAAK
jgi:hypothetical protein